MKAPRDIDKVYRRGDNTEILILKEIILRLDVKKGEEGKNEVSAEE